jgi:MFS family permease
MFGNYYVYDSISPLADVLKAQLSFSDAGIGLLDAIYGIPNVFMVLIAGFIIDRIGARKATMLFGILCFAGVAIAVLSGVLAVMAAGRLVLGLGAESLIVAVTTAIAIILLFLTGYSFGRAVGYRPWQMGLSMVLIGSILVAMTMAPGG